MEFIPPQSTLHRFFLKSCELDTDCGVHMTTPNEGFLISKVLMITFDLLTARAFARAVSFYPLPISIHVQYCPVLAPARPAHP